MNVMITRKRPNGFFLEGGTLWSKVEGGRVGRGQENKRKGEDIGVSLRYVNGSMDGWVMQYYWMRSLVHCHPANIFSSLSSPPNSPFIAFTCMCVWGGGERGLHSLHSYSCHACMDIRQKAARWGPRTANEIGWVHSLVNLWVSPVVTSTSTRILLSAFSTPFSSAWNVVVVQWE